LDTWEIPEKFGNVLLGKVKISWTDRVRNEEVLHRDNEERNILHIIEGEIDGGIEVMGRQGRRRRKQLLND
jgi:hypothetical protein